MRRHLIKSLSLSASEETIVCSTSRNHIFSAPLQSSEIDNVRVFNQSINKKLLIIIINVTFIEVANVTVDITLRICF